MGLDYSQWNSQLWEYDEAYQEAYASEHNEAKLVHRECLNDQCPICEREQDETFQRQYRINEAHRWIAEAPYWTENGVVTVKFTEDRWKELLEVLGARISIIRAQEEP